VAGGTAGGRVALLDLAGAPRQTGRVLRAAYIRAVSENAKPLQRLALPRV
jgi:hypothetical protein